MHIEQKSMWNKKHGRGDHTQYGVRPSDFAREVEPLFPRKAQVLELGCGIGHDSFFFAEQEHNVIATDFSDVVIQQNSVNKQHANLNFQVLDMMHQPWTFEEDTFDVVYSHLALHYFTAKDTRRIFKEIHRVLKPGGKLFFVCKSIYDKYYGQGDEIEKDMFLLKGHMRHLYSKQFAQQMLERLFEIEVIDFDTNDFYGKKSGFLRCYAHKAP